MRGLRLASYRSTLPYLAQCSQSQFPPKPSRRSRLRSPMDMRLRPARTARAAICSPLPRGVIDRLNAMRGLGQSYSDAILALAKGE